MDTILLLAVAVVAMLYLRKLFMRRLLRHHVAPLAADTAGWLLFSGLAFLAMGGLGIQYLSRFLSLAMCSTLLVFGVAALAAALLTGRQH